MSNDNNDSKLSAVGNTSNSSIHPPPYSPYLPTPNFTYDPTSSNTVVLSSPVLDISVLGTMPALTTCPHCQHTVLSNVRYEYGGCTWLSCLVLGLFGAGPFCFIPFCVNDLKDAIHYCPSCGRIMVKYCRFDGNVYKYINYS